MALIAMLSLNAVARADSLQDALAERLQSQPLAQVYDWLSRMSASPDEQAERQRWLGQIALAQDDYVRAARHFEKVVVLRPNDMGTRLDLAIAYTEQGNLPAARASLAALRHRLDGAAPPPGAAERIAELERRLARASQAPRRSWFDDASGSIGLAGGYDSNANLGSRHDSLAVDLWGELPLRLELAEPSRAQGSAYSQVDARVRLPLSETGAGQGRWSLLAGADLRRYHDLDTLDRRGMHLGLQWLGPQQRRQFTLLGYRQQIDGYDSRSSLEASVRQRLGDGWLAGLGTQWQQEPELPASRTLRLELWREWHRALFWWQGSRQWRPQRPAGDTWRLELGAESPPWRIHDLALSAFINGEYRRDTEAYSPQFFGQDARREITRRLGARGWLPLGAHWLAELDLSWERTDSTIALFDTTRLQAEARLEWHF